MSVKPPVADMHLHYKWSQQEVTSPGQAAAYLKQENIVLGVVIGTPAELALELQREMPDRIVSIFSPYQTGGDWFRWAQDESVINRARDALASGLYHGVGELHLIGGFVPSPEKNYVLQQLMHLVVEYDVPILLHTEFSTTDYLLSLCNQHDQAKIIWAHAGAIISPEQVGKVLDSCKNVSAGLAARDPWRFIDNQITDNDGVLHSNWKKLFIKYQDRFMLGSDPVWPVDQLDRWDEPDTGWNELYRFWQFHRSWLDQLPYSVREKIRVNNAKKKFNRVN